MRVYMLMRRYACRLKVIFDQGQGFVLTAHSAAGPTLAALLPVLSGPHLTCGLTTRRAHVSAAADASFFLR